MVEVVAEWGQSCRGDVEVAMRQADAAKHAGCTWAKWQTFNPDRLVSRAAGRYWNAKLGGAKTQHQTFVDNGMLAPSDWRVLAEYCDHIGIEFLSSPFDLEAVDLLAEAGAAAFKVASGEITHKQLLRRIAQTGLPVFLSTGAATTKEISQAITWLDPIENITLLACTLSYPCPVEEAHLARIGELSWQFGMRTGYSDHTTRVDTALAAVAVGAEVLEKHCTLSSEGDVPDDKMALDPEQLRQYVDFAILGDKMHGVGSLTPTQAEMAARVGARRSVHAAKDIPPGKKLRATDLVCLRPGGPFAPADIGALVGRKVSMPISAGEQLLHFHFE